MKSLAVRVLGVFGVDGVAPQALGRRKARLALQLLAMADGQAVPSDVLIDAIWDENPPARPDDQLAVLMSRLRSVLGRDRRVQAPASLAWLRLAPSARGGRRDPGDPLLREPVVLGGECRPGAEGGVAAFPEGPGHILAAAFHRGDRAARVPGLARELGL